MTVRNHSSTASVSTHYRLCGRTPCVRRDCRVISAPSMTNTERPSYPACGDQDGYAARVPLAGVARR
jgi:hypothetical protein